MRCVLPTSAVYAASALLAGCMFVESRAHAAESRLSGGARPPRLLLFSGTDIWRRGGSLYGGLVWAPRGLGANSFSVKVLSGGGAYRYVAHGRPIQGFHAFDSLMAGYRFSRENLHVAIHAGLDLQNHWLIPRDGRNPLRGFHAGMRVNADLWWEPRQKMMLSASVSAGTIGPSYSLRAAAGWRLFDRFYLGPEIAAHHGNRYGQYRFGVHLTGLRTGRFEWSGGVGHLAGSAGESSLYGRFGLLLRY